MLEHGLFRLIKRIQTQLMRTRVNYSRLAVLDRWVSGTWVLYLVMVKDLSIGGKASVCWRPFLGARLSTSEGPF